MAAGCLIVTLSACGGESSVRPPLQALDEAATLLRIPRSGGPATAHRPSDLQPLGWSTTGRLPPIQHVLGADLDERLVYAIDRERRLVAIDLASRGVRRNIAEDIAQATISGDGSLYYFDSRSKITHLYRRMPTRYQAPAPAATKTIYGTISDRLVAVTEGDRPRASLLTATGEPEEFPAPLGPVAATHWGELLALGSDTGVVLIDTQRRSVRGTIDLDGQINALAFSPSGHELYAAVAASRLVVIDRFNEETVARINLPAPATAMRTDGSGRWLLLFSEAQDSINIVDIPSRRVITTLAGKWDDDLPLIIGATLIRRIDDNVEAIDLSTGTPTLAASLVGGATDFWVSLSWVPSSTTASADETTPMDSTALPTGPGMELIPPVLPTNQPPTQNVYLQVSSSQNPNWARELARQLVADGWPAQVRDPSIPDEGYRVLIGPYTTREAAEEAGRRLGRPFFVQVDPTPSP